MSKKTESPLETGMLSWRRSVQITEGLFFATSSHDDYKPPIEVHEKGVRGQSSDDEAKKPGLSNPQTVEHVVVPQDHDGTELSFSLRVMPFSLKPHSCDNTKVRDAYMRLAEGYRAAGGYGYLAELIAWNIANARFAWRNRFQSDVMTVTVDFDDVKIVFDPFQVSLEKPGIPVIPTESILEGDSSILGRFIDGIAYGLSNTEKGAFAANIRWNAVMQPGQEVFPSQEYLRNSKQASKPEDRVSRVYAKLPAKNRDGETIGQASMHSQKIGAALRHIDIWHGDDTHDAAIPVNPYGGVQESGKALRAGDGNLAKSFYALRKNAVTLFENVDQARDSNDISDDVHFVIANLVRGGVFGKKS